MTDNVNHPSHYLKAAVTVEPIELTARLNSCIGQALQYVFRAPYKDNQIEDLKKAVFYLKKQLVIGDLPNVFDCEAAYVSIFQRHTKDIVTKTVLSLIFEEVWDDESPKFFYYDITEEGLEKAIEFLEARIEKLEGNLKSFADPIEKDEEC